eukprot:Platyproteum_vivax@DN7591_c3_g1_i2.p1
MYKVHILNLLGLVIGMLLIRISSMKVLMKRQGNLHVSSRSLPPLKSGEPSYLPLYEDLVPLALEGLTCYICEHQADSVKDLMKHITEQHTQQTTSEGDEGSNFSYHSNGPEKAPSAQLEVGSVQADRIHAPQIASTFATQRGNPRDYEIKTIRCTKTDARIGA